MSKIFTSVKKHLKNSQHQPSNKSHQSKWFLTTGLMAFFLLTSFFGLKANANIASGLTFESSISGISSNLAPIRISGQVIDSLTNEPLSGVTIRVQGTNNGAVSDENGNFNLEAEGNSILEVSFVGYTSKVISLNGRTSLTISLASSATGLDQLVVVGYGTQKKETVTGAIASIQGDKVTESPVMNVSNALAGKIPGVSFTSRSGEPGQDGSTIRIRGVNTLGDNNPLIVVDGIPGRSLDRVDPNSIASISVLKDASAAIYGSQAGNGVILVTTKRGKIGKPLVTVNFDKGFTSPTRLPKLLNAAQYAEALNELDAHQGLTPRYTQEDLDLFANGQDPWGHPNSNYEKAVLKNWANQLQGNINVSGGSEFTRYFVSLNYKTQDAIYRGNSNTNFSQYDFTTNLDFDLSKDIKLAVGMIGRVEDNHLPGHSNSDLIFSSIIRAKPNMAAYWPTGELGPDIERGENPAALAQDVTGFTHNKNYVFNSNIKLDINIPWIDGLSLSGSAAFDKNFVYNRNFETPWFLYSWDGQSVDDSGTPILNSGIKGVSDPRLTQTSEDNYTFLLNGILNYTRIFSDVHHFSFLAGTESRGDNDKTFDAFRRYFASTSLPQLDAGGTNQLTNSGTASHTRRLNYFGRVNYDYDNKYLAEFVWRVDGSYIFPEASRYGFFPGGSLGWRISEEDFWKNSGISRKMNDLKLRVSYGLTGNDRIDPYQFLTTYAFGDNPYIFNETEENTTIHEQRIPNPNITWERAKQFDAGFDMGLFDDKILLTFDYFDYHRSDILWPRNASVPASTGLTLPRENIGKTKNTGFDLSASYQNKFGAFDFSVALTGGYAKNKILFWDEAPGVPVYQRFTGHPMPTSSDDPNADLYYQAIGIFKDQSEVDRTPHWENAEPGDVIFEDVNGDGLITADDRVRADKTDIPTLTGGLNLGLKYKGFDLSVFFQGAAGAEKYIMTDATGNFGNYLLSDFIDHWTPENTDATRPRLFERTDQYFRSQRNTYLLHNTDYIRLKNIEVGYSFPANLVSGAGIETLRIYFRGFNLATWSPHYKDFDPEDNRTSYMKYPLQKVVSFGITVSF